jgi:hypothetical protein
MTVILFVAVIVGMAVGLSILWKPGDIGPRVSRRELRRLNERWASGISDGLGAHSNKTSALTLKPTTLGWTDCGHDKYRRGIVLDPFVGSGTTLMAASELGRDSIGIDLDSRNLELARQRCGMFLVEDEGVVV